MRIHELITENLLRTFATGASAVNTGAKTLANVIKPAAQISNTVVKQEQFMDLLGTASHLRSMFLVHIGQIAKDPAAAAKLTDMFNQLKGPAINNMTWSQLINQPASVLTNPKMASALINNTKQTIEYVEAMIIRYGNPASPGYQSRMDYIKTAKDRYRAVVAP